MLMRRAQPTEGDHGDLKEAEQREQRARWENDQEGKKKRERGKTEGKRQAAEKRERNGTG